MGPASCARLLKRGCAALLQTRAPHTLTGLQLSFLVNALAAPCLLLFSTLPRRLLRRPRRVHEQHALLFYEWVKYRLGRIRRTASLQALLPLLRGEAAVEQALPVPQEVPPRGPSLQRPSLVEDLTTCSLDAAVRPQAVMVSISCRAAPAPYRPASLQHGLGIAHHTPQLTPLHSAPVTPRGWPLPHAQHGSAFAREEAAWSAPAAGASQLLGWPSRGAGAGTAVSSGLGGGAEAGTAEPAGMCSTALPPSEPSSPAAGAHLSRLLPPGSPRGTAEAALRQPLLQPTVQEEEEAEGWLLASPPDLEAGGSPTRLSSPAGSWASALSSPSSPRGSGAALAYTAEPAGALGGVCAQMEQGRGPGAPAAEEGGQQAPAVEEVVVTLKPYTLHHCWVTPWALAASERQPCGP